MLVAGGFGYLLYVDDSSKLRSVRKMCSRGILGWNSSIFEGIPPYTKRKTLPRQTIAHLASNERYSIVWTVDGKCFATGQTLFRTKTWREVASLAKINVSQVTSGGQHTLIVDTDGQLWNFGEQVGFGHMRFFTGPQKRPEFPRVKLIASGLRFGVVVDYDDMLWGLGQFPYSGVQHEKDITPVGEFDSPVKAVRCTSDACFVLLDNGLVHGCGDLQKHFYTRVHLSQEMAEIKSLEDIEKMTCGRDNALFFDCSGQAWLLGPNYCSDFRFATSSDPVRLEQFDGYEQVEAFGESIVYLHEGALYSYGNINPMNPTDPYLVSDDHGVCLSYSRARIKSANC